MLFMHCARPGRLYIIALNRKCGSYLIELPFFKTATDQGQKQELVPGICSSTARVEWCWFEKRGC